MKFELDIQIANHQQTWSLAELELKPAAAKLAFASPASLQAAAIPLINGKVALTPYLDPLFYLAEQWLLKLPWLLSGDTETLPLRDSNYIFGLESVNEAVYLSFYVGDQVEVEDYILEPVAIPVEEFCEASIGAMKKLCQLLQTLQPEFCATSSDFGLLKTALDEAEKALKNHRLKK